MNTITKRKALNDVFKQFQRLPEWPTEKKREPTQLEPKCAHDYLKTRQAQAANYEPPQRNREQLAAAEQFRHL